MKKVKMFMMLMGVVSFFAAALDSQAASARVRCRIRSGELRIQVDGQDLSRGTYGARVKNARTGNIVKTDSTKRVTVTIAPDDIDLDFDSSIEPHDLDTLIPLNFAKVGDTVRASVINVKTNVVVAAASTTCVSN